MWQFAKTGALLQNFPGTVQNDVLKEYIARVTYIIPCTRDEASSTDLFRGAAQSFPSGTPSSILRYHIREAGSTAVQEASRAPMVSPIDSGALDAGSSSIIQRLNSLSLQRPQRSFEEIANTSAARRLMVRDHGERSVPRIRAP